MPLACVLCLFTQLRAQLPFYTDDTGVTDRGKWHFEFFNEYDALQLQYPNVRQNTANFKLNYGLPHQSRNRYRCPHLPFSSELREISRPAWCGRLPTWELSGHSTRRPKGPGCPALGASFYTEFPTGDASNQLGSGLVDYWLNFIQQKSFSDKTRITGNLGILFAGNTSTGVLGLRNTRGQVYTGGVSLLHDFTPRLTLGGELYGGYAENDNLGKTQLQAMGGGQYELHHGLSFCFGLLGGRYVASPQIGGQVGFAVDFPDL